jgi:hypothetical protein
MKNLEVLNGKKLESINKKPSIGEKLDNSWRTSKPMKKKMLDSKKLVVKLETTGKEKRKILLKLEGGSSNVHSGNFNLISELLKEFFKNGES